MNANSRISLFIGTCWLLSIYAVILIVSHGYKQHPTVVYVTNAPPAIATNTPALRPVQTVSPTKLESVFNKEFGIFFRTDASNNVVDIGDPRELFKALDQFARMNNFVTGLFQPVTGSDTNGFPITKGVLVSHRTRE